MTKLGLQGVINKICKEYKVPVIKLVFTDRKGRGLACYNTYCYKIGGKVQKQHYPRNITIYSWGEIKGYPGEVAMRVGHELAHHIQNMKKNSLLHSTTFYNLEEALAYKLSKVLKK